MVGRLASTGDVAGESRCRCVTAPAIASCRVGRIESGGGPRIARRRAARQHAKVVRRLMAGLAGGHRGRYRGMPIRAQ